jgi:O-antigen/teichoic acid export membrane protein
MGGIVNVILNYILIKKIGIIGAAIATYVSWTIIAIIRIFDIRKILKFEINYKKIFIYFILLFAQTCVITVFDNICGQMISLFIAITFAVMERDLIVQIFELALNKLKRVRKNGNKEII